jgi:hypothetical protein
MFSGRSASQCNQKSSKYTFYQEEILEKIVTGKSLGAMSMAVKYDYTLGVNRVGFAT